MKKTFGEIFYEIIKKIVGTLGMIFGAGLALLMPLMCLAGVEDFAWPYIIMEIAFIPAGCLIFSRSLGWAYLKDEYEKADTYTGYTDSNGRTTMAPDYGVVNTRNFLIRKIVMNFIVTVLCLIEGIRAIILAVTIKAPVLGSQNLSEEVTGLWIIGALLIVEAVIFMLVGGFDSIKKFKTKDYADYDYYKFMAEHEKEKQ